MTKKFMVCVVTWLAFICFALYSTHVLNQGRVEQQRRDEISRTIAKSVLNYEPIPTCNQKIEMIEARYYRQDKQNIYGDILVLFLSLSIPLAAIPGAVKECAERT